VVSIAAFQAGERVLRLIFLSPGGPCHLVLVDKVAPSIFLALGYKWSDSRWSLTVNSSLHFCGPLSVNRL